MKVNIFGLIKELVNSMYFILHVHVCYFEIMIEILTSLPPPQKKTMCTREIYDYSKMNNSSVRFSHQRKTNELYRLVEK